MYDCFENLKFITAGFSQEWKDIEMMNEDNMRIRDEIDILRGKYVALKKFAHEKKISLPPEMEAL